MFEEKLSSLPQILHPVCPMPSHAHLEHLPEKERELTLIRAARAAQTPLSRILASDWLAFSRTGDRAHFEGLYFPRRRRLTDLVCGFLLKEDSRWLEEAANTIWALCEESAWQLPAHNSMCGMRRRLRGRMSPGLLSTSLPRRPAHCFPVPPLSLRIICRSR